MARLNEPPIAPAAVAATATSLVNGVGTAGAESVEVLKRRFIRQNRELAKNNSTQSLRIRSLELEVSKLLGDSLDLREQVLNLQNELYNARMQASNAAARRVKNDLKAKLAELSGLIDGMDEEEVEDSRDVPEKARILSPSRQQYRERQPLAELMQETQMPTIAEDKMFPRRTLDEEEVRQIRLSNGSAATGSPDLGPPPVAHFDELPKLSQEEEVEEEGDENNGEDELLPTINLETRRKRKDPSLPRESRRSSIMAHSPDKVDEAPSTMLRTGAKRKLADRDTEKPIKPPASDDFTFSRRASAVQPAPDETEPEAVDIKAPAEEIERPVSPVKPARRVLGDKSTNMSPIKTTRRVIEETQKDDLKKPGPPKLGAAKDRPSSRGSRRVSSVSSIPIPPTQDDIVSTVDIPPPRPSSADLIPQTPAALDLFSPATSQPSAQQNGGCDTPPPSDLSTISNTTEGGQRPSRRARSAVNYAEPSLVAKMRRPDKKMADAISGLHDHRRVMSASSTTSKRTGSGVVKIKEEHADEPSWSGLPHTSSLSRESMGSPLRHLTTDDGPHLSPRPSPRLSPSRPSSLLLSADMGDNIEVASRPSSTSGSISTLLANSRKRREALDKRISPPPSTASTEAVDAAAKRLEELDLYEFKESSSPASVEEVKTTTRTSHRRHSSVPKVASVAVAPERTVKSVASAETSSSAAAQGHGVRMASRRRSMML
ncbi:putative shugoshin [Septoria linicola]|nr:putative shugoshin [Septoria linicola]